MEALYSFTVVTGGILTSFDIGGGVKAIPMK